ncbi:MAG: DUF4102 domain-containing protein [Bradyrhizobium sp.]|nr:MAG: DUF4102 domain-containing protein [Bradyrhizobium sp.]
MSRKQTRTGATASRTAKVTALIKHPGTPLGEQQAGVAALERLGGPLARPTTPGNHLTDADVRKLQPPATGNKITYDGAPAGFGVRVTAAGTKSFIFNYRVKTSGQERRYTIGEFGSWSTSAARAEAKKLRSKVDGGGDPRGEVEEQREAPTMSELCDRFEREHLPKRRVTTQKQYARLIRLYIRPHFGKFAKVSDIKFADIDKLHGNVTKKSGPYNANRCVGVLSKMFSLAIKWEWRTTNPCRGIERNPEPPRKRYLSGEELMRLTMELTKQERQFADIIRLLLLTGARRGEVLGMRWSALDLTKGIWTKPAAETKQASLHVVPLSEPVVTLLKAIERGKSEFVFPSDSTTGHVVEISKAWWKLRESAGLSDLRIHDLRHSFASYLASSGASLPLIGALLGHSNPTTTARYAHLFMDPQRAAAEKVAAIVGNGGRHG